eukprot:XP_011537390.1 refilin-A [Homo sapiens]
MVGHLHLQGMEDSLKEQGREGLLDSPDSGLPPSPSPSPPFYSLAPGILDARAGGAGASSEPPGPSEARAVDGPHSVIGWQSCGSLHSLPRAAVTKCHRLGGLTQKKFILSEFRRPRSLKSS